MFYCFHFQLFFIHTHKDYILYNLGLILPCSLLENSLYIQTFNKQHNNMGKSRDVIKLKEENNEKSFVKGLKQKLFLFLCHFQCYLICNNVKMFSHFVAACCFTIPGYCYPRFVFHSCVKTISAYLYYSTYCVYIPVHRNKLLMMNELNRIYKFTIIRLLWKFYSKNHFHCLLFSMFSFTIFHINTECAHPPTICEHICTLTHYTTRLACSSRLDAINGKKNGKIVGEYMFGKWIS